MEKKAAETQQCRVEIEQYSDQILSMESWLKGQLEREAMVHMLRSLYNEEFDEEEQGLREL